MIVFLLIKVFVSGNSKQTKSKFDYEEVVTDIGNIEVTVEGKGTIEENSVYNIFPTVTGEIIEDHIFPSKYFVDNISKCMKLHKLQICEYKKVIHSKQNNCSNNLQFPFLHCLI